MLLEAGKTCKDAWFLTEGYCRSFILKDGKDITTNFFQPGKYTCDYHSYLTNTPSTENIQALEYTIGVSLTNTDLQHLYRNYPSYNRYGRLLGESLFITTHESKIQLLSKNPKARYNAILEKKPWIIKKVPQHHIASFLGITPEYLSRLKSDQKSFS